MIRLYTLLFFFLPITLFAQFFDVILKESQVIQLDTVVPQICEEKLSKDSVLIEGLQESISDKLITLLVDIECNKINNEEMLSKSTAMANIVVDAFSDEFSSYQKQFNLNDNHFMAQNLQSFFKYILLQYFSKNNNINSISMESIASMKSSDVASYFLQVIEPKEFSDMLNFFIKNSKYNLFDISKNNN